MLNEKDIKLTINKLFNEIKNIRLEQQNAIYSIGIRTCQVIALMKIIGRNDIFAKEELEADNLLSKINSRPLTQKDLSNAHIDKTKIDLIRNQLTLADIPEKELQDFIKKFNKNKTKNKDIQELIPTERV